MSEQSELLEINKYLDLWSGGIHPRTFSALKDKIQIISLFRYPIGYLYLQTLTEQRIVYPSFSQVTDEPMDPLLKYAYSEEVDPWQVVMHNPPSDFKEESYIVNVPNATRILSCHNCNGTGAVNCLNCGTSGFITCVHCAGTGESMCTECEGKSTVNCKVCEGKGVLSSEKIREWQTDDGVIHSKKHNVLEPCDVCLGSGQMTCPSCINGSVSCTYCHGEGKNICLDCNGKGKLVCEVCGGKKSLVNTLITKQKFLKTDDSLVFNVPEVSRKYGDYQFYLNKNAIRDLKPLHDVTVEGQLPVSEYSSFAPSDYMEQYDRINRAHEFFKYNLSKKRNEKIVRQRVQFFQVDCILMQYQYNGQIYELFIDTHNDGFLALNNPFLDMAKTIYKNAEKAFEDKKFGVAFDLAKEAAVYFKDTEKESDVHWLIERINMAMKKHYLYGLIAGLFGMILIKFITLINLKSTLVYIILPICATLIASFILFKFTPKFFIKSDYVRLAIGLMISILLFLIISFGFA